MTDASDTQDSSGGDVAEARLMDDAELIRRISQLVDEEHQLDNSDGALDESQAERLRQVEVQLDQCWDLLRRRRARRKAGEDPDAAEVRDPETVETYLQ